MERPVRAEPAGKGNRRISGQRAYEVQNYFWPLKTYFAFLSKISHCQTLSPQLFLLSLSPEVIGGASPHDDRNSFSLSQAIPPSGVKGFPLVGLVLKLFSNHLPTWQTLNSPASPREFHYNIYLSSEGHTNYYTKNLQSRNSTSSVSSVIFKDNFTISKWTFLWYL